MTSAAAGGAMLALCADIVAARERVMLNPHYRMGLTGSELHTLTLPRRVGTATATRLLVDGETLDTHTARDLGLIDHIGPNPNGEFDAWLSNLAHSLSGPGILTRTTKAPSGIASPSTISSVTNRTATGRVRTRDHLGRGGSSTPQRNSWVRRCCAPESSMAHSSISPHCEKIAVTMTFDFRMPGELCRRRWR
ncbi:enoyl-CoA hydratase-related protein (plasmid) [Nocardia sp. NBC_01377]|uniref:enoyl-CoA hydratase-related protein n=1 Tax=Nocardia sp. NBC_01377 TaxID=2903595 RepID=UPI002F90D4B7